MSASGDPTRTAPRPWPLALAGLFGKYARSIKKALDHSDATDCLGEFERERENELREHRRKLDRVVNQIDQLVSFIADGHGSASVAEKLRGLEREAEAERNALATLERDGATVIRLPAPDDLLEIVFDLEKRLRADPASGREELRRIFRDGRITLVPQPDGFYIARSEILPLVLLTPPAPQEDLGGRYTASSCAGRI
jgi:hypothetical protein